MTLIKELQPVTLAEFETMEKQEGLTYELIDSVVMMSPRPAVKHQKTSLRLSAELLALLRNKDCDVIQEIDLVLEDNYFVPDIMIVCGEKFEGTRHEKPPLIVVEIVSPSNASHDYITKRHKYEQLGIQEYWIVSPDEKCIWIISFTANTQEHYCEGKAISHVMPEIVIDLNDIFE